MLGINIFLTNVYDLIELGDVLRRKRKISEEAFNTCHFHGKNKVPYLRITFALGFKGEMFEISLNINGFIFKIQDYLHEIYEYEKFNYTEFEKLKEHMTATSLRMGRMDEKEKEERKKEKRERKARKNANNT